MPSYPAAERPLTSPEDQVVDSQVQGMIATAGEDENGHPRLAYERGRDLLTYPRAQSKVSYNNHRLDGSRRTAKKRRREGEWPFYELCRSSSIGGGGGGGGGNTQA